jgi:phage-related protein
MRRARGASDDLDKATGRGGKQQESFRHRLFETLGIVREATHWFGFAADKARSFLAMLEETAGGAEKTSLSLRTKLGAGLAREVLANVEEFSRLTALQGGEAGRQVADLIASGFDKTSFGDVIAAALDLEAIKPGSLPQVLDLFQDLQTMGVMTSRTLLALKGRVSIPDVVESIAKRTGAPVDQVKDLLEKGKVSAQVGQQAIFDAIEKMTGQRLGAVAKEAGQTLPALLHKVADFPGQFFEGLTDSAGFASIKGFLQNVLDLLGPKSAFGAELQEAIGDVFDQLFDRLSTGGPEALKDAFSGLIPFIRSIPEIVSKAIDVLRVLWDVVAFGAAVIGGIIDAVRFWVLVGDLLGDSLAQLSVTVETFFFATLPGAVKHAAAGLFTAAVEIGTALWQGIKEGIESGIDAVAGAVKGMASSVVDTVKDIFRTGSPSKVFIDIGRSTTEGFALGVTSTAPRIDSALSAFGSSDLSAPSMGAGGGVSAGRGDITIGSIQVVLGSDVSRNDAEDIGNAVARSVRRELHHFESALELGGG